MAKRKNVLVFHADQMRADAVAACGNLYARTPNLDRLAASATVFTRHVAANPVCMPSRASFFTGLYPTAHGIWTNGVPLNRREYIRYDRRYEDWGRICIVPEPPTLADVFAAAGYDTAALGKLHLTPTLAPVEYGLPESTAVWETGRLDDWHGPYYGFRHVEFVKGHGEQVCDHGHYANWLKSEHPEVHHEVHATRESRHRPVPKMPHLYASRVPARLYNSAWLGDRACAYLRAGRPQDKPFFLFVGFPDPHHPFTPSFDVVGEFEQLPVAPARDPEGLGLRGSPAAELKPGTVADLTEGERRMVVRYTHAMVYQLDLAVGQVLAELDSLGLRDGTIVVFTSDHGDFLCDHGLVSKGNFASDALLRVPFILRAPGAAAPGRVDAVMSNVDVLPTLAALAGVAPPAYQHGRNVLAGDPRASAPVGGAARAFAYATSGFPEMVNQTCYDDRHRLTWYPFSDYVELFDHESDPGESRNVADDPTHARRREQLKSELALATARNTFPCLGGISAW